jgi:hypothetical protein
MSGTGMLCHAALSKANAEVQLLSSLPFIGISHKSYALLL